MNVREALLESRNKGSDQIRGGQITTADFGALVQDLVAALDTFNVPSTENHELLSLLGVMKHDIVEVP